MVRGFGRVALEVLEELAAADELTGRVHGSYMDFLRQAARYNALMDQEMLRQRGLVIA